MSLDQTKKCVCVCVCVRERERERERESWEYFVCYVEHLEPQGSSDIMHKHNNSNESLNKRGKLKAPPANPRTYLFK